MIFVVDIADRQGTPPRIRTNRPERQVSDSARKVLAGLRIAMGWTFLWPFLDKLFGLGYSTPSAKSWLNGGSPTKGFLSGAEGPFGGIFRSFAGAPLANVGFMLGLLAIGVALLLGIGMRLAAAGGAVLVVLMWAASLPLESNPFLDEHLIYAGVLVALALLHAGGTWGLGRAWGGTTLVQRFPWLQ